MDLKANKRTAESGLLPNKNGENCTASCSHHPPWMDSFTSYAFTAYSRHVCPSEFFLFLTTKTRENFRTKQNFSSGMGNLSLLSSMFSTGQFWKEKSDRFSTNSLQSFQIKSSSLVLVAFSLYIKRWYLSCRNRLFFSPLRFQTGAKHNQMITGVCKFQLAGKWSETCPVNYVKGWKEKRLK